MLTNDTSLFRAAIHEAGHAVSSWAGFKVAPKSIEVYRIITKTECGYRGETGGTQHPPGSPKSRDEWVKVIATFYAGREAVKLALENAESGVSSDPNGYSPGEFGFKGGFDSDEGNIKKFLAQAGQHNADYDAMKTEAENLAAQQILDNYQCVLELAKCLCSDSGARPSEKRILEQDKIRSILETYM